MTFTYKNRRYRIWFQHFTDPAHVRRTECTIVELTSPSQAVELVSDDAFCADGDVYKKETGRKLSLARALLRASQDREFRRTAWMAYHSRKGASNVSVTTS